MMMLLLSSYYAGHVHSSIHKAVVWWVSVHLSVPFLLHKLAQAWPLASICFIHSCGEQMNWQSVVFTIRYFFISFHLFSFIYLLNETIKNVQ